MQVKVIVPAFNGVAGYVRYGETFWCEEKDANDYIRRNMVSKVDDRSEVAGMKPQRVQAFDAAPMTPEKKSQAPLESKQPETPELVGTLIAGEPLPELTPEQLKKQQSLSRRGRRSPKPT